MKIIRDFKCKSCEKVIERFIDAEVIEITCECGCEANKVIGLPTIKLEGITGAFPGAYHKWADDREKRARKHAEKTQKE
jgi:hypothetical protein